MSAPGHFKPLPQEEEQLITNIIENIDGVVVCDEEFECDGLVAMTDEIDKNVLWVRCWYRIKVNLLEERILRVLEANDGCCMDNDEERQRVAKALAKELR